MSLKRLLRNKIESVQELAANEWVVRAVRGQNERAVPLDRIKEIDAEWVRAKGVTPFKRSLQENEVGRYFKSMVDFNQSIHREVFLAHRQGATVEAYPATTTRRVMRRSGNKRSRMGWARSTSAPWSST